MQICSVCSEQTPKYRCPACKIRYCSLGCYKLHKDTCLPVTQPTPTDPEVRDTFTSGQSKELRDLLCNPHLRQLLHSIDSADSKDDAMKAAMQEPLFVEFSDRCLKIVDNEDK
ncbi:zinc finger HIT domain-containing protein 3 isoform X2 [Pleuronectes platessa]|uniref:zinc finger HIT domain-containing protein 3 isoform X2 n=1 Tax=Pleuronectes platessa TaxID=8262 RepID=UPI00232A63CE|nr:zinc finger HIT domain-containing protein 3 isoform X2 [Pleuronectes platessa]